MTDKTPPECDPGAPDEILPYPTATPEQMPTGGGKVENLVGRWPGEIDDGFEEWIHEIRGHYRPSGRRSW